MLKEFQDAYDRAEKRKRLSILAAVVAGVIFSTTLASVIHYSSLFSSSTKSSTSSSEKSKQTHLIVTNSQIKVEADNGPSLIQLYPEYASAIVNELIERSKVGSSAKAFELDNQKNKKNILKRIGSSLVIPKTADQDSYLNNLFVGFRTTKKIHNNINGSIHDNIKEQSIIIGKVLQELNSVGKSEYKI